MSLAVSNMPVLTLGAKSTSGLKIHYTPSASGRPSICPFCNKTVTNQWATSKTPLEVLRSHLEQSHGPETGFVCKVCSGPSSTLQHVFMDAETATEHLKSSHRNLDSSDLKSYFAFPADNRMFRCLKCSQMFLAQDFHQGGILDHVRTAHGRDPNCSGSPQRSGEDVRLSASQVVTLQCRKCDGIFRDESILVQHGKFCHTK